MRIPGIRTALTAIAAGLIGTASAMAAPAQTTLQVFYAYPNNYKPVLERIAGEFEAAHPDIRISFWTPASSYDTATPQVLRGALTGQVPDVFFTGLNYLRVLKDQDLLVPLDGFVKTQAEWEAMGYRDAMLAMGSLGSEVYALPFAISMPVLYVNEDLVRRAGLAVDTLPKDWRGLAEVGAKIAALDPTYVGFFFAYDASGNWGLQQLVNSAGGEMGTPDGCGLRFDEKPGQWTFETLEMFHKLGMPAYSQDQVRAAFAAGTVGIYAASTSQIARMEKAAAGKFGFRILPYPLPSEASRLPAGGSVAAITTRDPALRKAAFEFLTFATGPVSATHVATYTGYMPGNQKALDDPELLGPIYVKARNNQPGLTSLAIGTGWYNWGGANGVKIVDVIQEATNSVAAGRESASQALPALANEVRRLLAGCAR
ncbi:multiple sugar transport system substrate-binding protein [Angulomicrobium tetraedrale]|uniref:Multiple sugar transport system substrate-binding protein n=1 Tax=Ancylobacter tetraedralis TaxID=217068 RepID=A0A839YY13_9HYPH|nr:extracellular solute-binding protein [Ancylobacter tetraedralis]MBB3769434.1 multiple sugar transport system substrate-binding protein [Ancylobacter tetraedralis]